MELESNEVELEADSDLIKRLHAEQRELQQKNSSLEQEVKDLKQVLDQEGSVIEEVVEDNMIKGQFQLVRPPFPLSHFYFPIQY